jgi:hypothetical protein
MCDVENETQNDCDELSDWPADKTESVAGSSTATKTGSTKVSETGKSGPGDGSMCVILL